MLSSIDLIFDSASACFLRSISMTFAGALLTKFSLPHFFMTEAQKQSYGDGLDPNCLHPYMWVCKSHYYGPTFYNFPYAFGALFARGLYSQYKQEGAAFVPKYKKMLHTTAVATAEDTAAVAGIDLTDKNFWRSALETVSQQIDQFCALVEAKA